MGKEDIDANRFVTLNEKKIKTDINKLIQYGDLIFTGKQSNKDNKGNVVDVYLKDCWVILVDSKAQNVITLYKIDLGLDDEFTRTYIAKMIEKLNANKEVLEGVQKQVQEESDTYKEMINNAETQIKEYRSMIKNLEELCVGYRTIIDNNIVKLAQANKSVTEVINALVNKREFWLRCKRFKKKSGDVISYKEFIDNILNTRGRFACRDEYHERHHIIPRCLGGTNDEENLIDLFAREHFEAHRLLALENPENKSLVYAWACMTFAKSNNVKRCVLSPNEYEEIRTRLSEIQKTMRGTKNSMYGKHHTEETKQKLRVLNSGKNNYMYGKCGKEHPMYGHKHSTEACKRMSKTHKQRIGALSSRARKVNQYTTDGQFIKTWDYIKQVSEELHINAAYITKCCRGKGKTAGGFKWAYYNEQLAQ